MPPVTYDKTTHATVPLNEGKLFVQNRKDQLAASAIAASRLAFLWWTFTGDCFNVTKGTMSQIPFSPHAYGQDTFDALVELGERIEEALPAVRSWDLNSGKYVGGYAIPNCVISPVRPTRSCWRRSAASICCRRSSTPTPDVQEHRDFRDDTAKVAVRGRGVTRDIRTGPLPSSDCDRSSGSGSSE
ncbi:hypothetical protein AB1285_23165 [Microbacterium sp. NRRL B-14842]|uniref:hypothetical protein n=1 Tax=Microbacterium sp. NRRL B-14842 TaxID=3162881 RepID=UPI003D2AD019